MNNKMKVTNSIPSRIKIEIKMFNEKDKHDFYFC